MLKIERSVLKVKISMWIALSLKMHLGAVGGEVVVVMEMPLSMEKDLNSPRRGWGMPKAFCWAFPDLFIDSNSCLKFSRTLEVEGWDGSMLCCDDVFTKNKKDSFFLFFLFFSDFGPKRPV